MSNDNKKLIEEALNAYWGGADNAKESGSFEGMRAALAVFEKAHTPTKTEIAIAAEIHTRYLRGEFDEDGQKPGDPSRAALLAAVRAGAKRSEVPEPSAVVMVPLSDLEAAWRVGAAHMSRADAAERALAALNERQGEPSDAQVEAAAEVIAVANGDGPWEDLLDTFQDEYRRDARAALRAAFAVTEQGD